MAEAKSTAKKTTTTQSSSSQSSASQAKPKASTKAVGSEQWKDILETTRESYMSSLKSLTKMQEETEKLVSNLAQKSKNLQEDNIKVVKEWIENGIKLRDDFKKIFEENYKKVLSLFEGLNVTDMEFPFKNQFEDMVKKMEENMKKYFSFLKF
jgi:hypothetical protein